MKTQIYTFPYCDSMIDYCIKEFKKGNVGIIPTDTVYGIGCDSLNTQALKKLYSIKNRSLDKPICILVSNIKMLNKFVKNVNHIEQKLIETFWPGPLTIIFDKSNIVPDILTSNLNTIGIRMPNNKICIDIIEKYGNPIAMSSANISNKSPNCDLNSLLLDFNNKVSFIITNKTLNTGVPSTIVKVQNNEIQVLREGSITKNDIIKCFGGNIYVR